MAPQEAIGLEEAIDRCVLPAHRRLRLDREERAAAAAQLAIAEVGTDMPHSSRAMSETRGSFAESAFLAAPQRAVRASCACL